MATALLALRNKVQGRGLLDPWVAKLDRALGSDTRQEFRGHYDITESLGDFRYDITESLDDFRYDITESLDDFRYDITESLDDFRYEPNGDFRIGNALIVDSSILRRRMECFRLRNLLTVRR